MKKTILKFNMVVAVIAMMLLATSCIKTQSGVDKDELKEIVTEAIHSVSTIETDSVSSSTVVFKGVESDADVDFHRVQLVAIIFGTVTGALIIILPVFLICYFIYRRRTIRYRIIEKAIENNVQLPTEFYKAEDARPRRSRLQSALVWIAWGVGIITFLLIADGTDGIGFGIIPILVGIAKLITYVVEDRKKPEDVE